MRIGTAMGITSRRRQKLGATLAAVTGLVVTTIDHNHAVLDWTDAASAPSGYRVYRQELDQSGNAVGSEILLGTVAQSVETYDDTFDVNILFEDDFSLGNFTKTMNGISWVSIVNTDAPIVSIARTGTRAARLNQASLWAEMRWGGMASLQEAYLEWYVFWPNGTEGVGPKATALGTHNSKFFRLWGKSLSGDGSDSYNGDGIYMNKVGASIWGDGGNIDGTIGKEFGIQIGGGAQTPMGEGDAEAHFDGLSDAQRGRWVRYRVHAKQASPSNNDGVLQIWQDAVLKINRSDLPNGDVHTMTTPGYTHGYLFGALSTDGAQAGQYAYVADFRISTGGFVS
jgi:hypothetical protein